MRGLGCYWDEMGSIGDIYAGNLALNSIMQGIISGGRYNQNGVTLVQV